MASSSWYQPPPPPPPQRDQRETPEWISAHEARVSDARQKQRDQGDTRLNWTDAVVFFEPGGKRAEPFASVPPDLSSEAQEAAEELLRIRETLGATPPVFHPLRNTVMILGRPVQVIWLSYGR